MIKANYSLTKNKSCHFLPKITMAKMPSKEAVKKERIFNRNIVLLTSKLQKKKIVSSPLP